MAERELPLASVFVYSRQLMYFCISKNARVRLFKEISYNGCLSALRHSIGIYSAGFRYPINQLRRYKPDAVSP